jgi:hypothetical protein
LCDALDYALKLFGKFGCTGRRRFASMWLSVVFLAVQRFESARRLLLR